MWEIPDQQRKKNLKTQERSGINIGFVGRLKEDTPAMDACAKSVETLKQIYKYGLKAFVLPEEIIKGTENFIDMSQVYKERYDKFLEIDRVAKKYKINLSLRTNSVSLMSEGNIKNIVMVFCHIVHILDADGFVIRPGSYGSLYEREAIRTIIQKLNSITSELKVDVPIGIETSGKLSEMGSLDHVLEIVKRTQHTTPILNFGYIHARGSGSLRKRSDFTDIFEEVEKVIGRSYFKEPIIYFSTVSYGPSGEKDYVPMKKCDMKLEYLVKEVIERGLRGTLIIDSPEKELDALEAIKILENIIR